MASPTRFDEYEHDPVTVARSLLGQSLVRMIDGIRVAGIIVEVEAYLGEEDRAAHTFGGRRTRRNKAMYRPGGHAYVYFIYGMHHCMNVVCGRADEGVAVLIRSLEPTEGLEVMRTKRPARTPDRGLSSGPAKLTQAMQINLSLNGIDLRSDTRLFIERHTEHAPPVGQIIAGPRVGVAYAGDWALRPLRFWLAGHRCVSGPVGQRKHAEWVAGCSEENHGDHRGPTDTIDPAGT